MPAPKDDPTPAFLDADGNPLAPDSLDAQGNPVWHDAKPAPKYLDASGTPMDEPSAPEPYKNTPSPLPAQGRTWGDVVNDVGKVAGAINTFGLSTLLPDAKPDNTPQAFPITPADVDILHPWDSAKNVAANLTDRAAQQLERPVPQLYAQGAGTVLDTTGRFGRTIAASPDALQSLLPVSSLMAKAVLPNLPVSGTGADPEKALGAFGRATTNALWNINSAPTVEDLKTKYGIGKLATKDSFFSTDPAESGSVEWDEWLRHAADFSADFAIGLLTDPAAWAHFGLSPEAAAAGKARLATMESAALRDAAPHSFATLAASEAPTLAEHIGAGDARMNVGPPNIPFTHFPFGEPGELNPNYVSLPVPKAVAPLAKLFGYINPIIGASDQRATMAYGKRIIDSNLAGEFEDFKREQVKPLNVLGAKLSAPDSMISEIYGPLHDALNGDATQPMELRLPLGDGAELAKSLGIKTQTEYPAQLQELIDRLRPNGDELPTEEGGKPSARLNKPNLADAIEAKQDFSVQHFADETVPALEKLADASPEDRGTLLTMLDKGRSIFQRLNQFAEKRGYKVAQLNGDLLDGPKLWMDRQMALKKMLDATPSDDQATAPSESLPDKLAAIDGKPKAKIGDILTRLDARAELTPEEMERVGKELDKQGPQVFAQANAVQNYRPAKLRPGALALTDNEPAGIGADVNRERGGEIDPKYGLPGVKPTTSEAEARGQLGGTGKASMQGQGQLGILGKAGNWRDAIVTKAFDSMLGRKLTPDGLKHMRDLFEQTSKDAAIYEGNTLRALPNYMKMLENGMSNAQLDAYTEKMFKTQPREAWAALLDHSRGVVDEPDASNGVYQENMRPAKNAELVKDFAARPELRTVRDATVPELQKVWAENGGTGDFIDQFDPKVKAAIEAGTTDVNDALKGQRLSTGELIGAEPYQMTRVKNLNGKDVYLDTGAANELNRLKQFSKDPFALRNFLGQAAPLVTYASQKWRQMQTVLGPQYLAALSRYQLHDIWRMQIGNLTDASTIREWSRINGMDAPLSEGPMMKYRLNNDPSAFANTALNTGEYGGVMAGDKVIRLAERNRVFNNHGSQGELDAVTSPTRVEPPSGFIPEQWARFKQLSDVRDNSNRLVAFTKLLRDGVSPAEASIRIHEGGLFDYSQNSPSTRFLAQTGVVPFANFYSNAIPFVAKWAASNYGEFAAAMRAMDAVRNGGLPVNAVPELMRDTFNMATNIRKDDKGNTLVQFTRGSGWFPLSEMTDLLDSASRASHGNVDAAYNQFKAILGPGPQMAFKLAEQGKEDEKDAAKKSTAQKLGEYGAIAAGKPGQMYQKMMPPALGGTLGEMDPRTQMTENPASTIANAMLVPWHSTTANVTQLSQLSVRSAAKNMKASNATLGEAIGNLDQAKASLRQERGLMNQASTALDPNDAALAGYVQKVNQAQARVARETAAWQEALRQDKITQKIGSRVQLVK